MKKIILIIGLIFVSFGCFNVNAEQYCPEDGGDCYDVVQLKDTLENTKGSNSINSNSNSESTTLTVRVTEKVPGANCTEDGTLSDGKTKVYNCTVERGFGTVKSTIGQIIKYFTYITGLAGVLYIIINGIMLSMSGLEQSMKDTAKKNIKKVIIGLLLLLLSGVFLNMIAPWVYQ